MVIIQFTGLSGSGKTTLASILEKKLLQIGVRVEVIDGDVYRREIFKDLGYSKDDRKENLKRLFYIANILVKHKIVVLISAINPYEEIRSNNRKLEYVRTVYLECPLSVLIQRDPKGYYKRALMEDGNPNKIANFTGISDPFEIPSNPDLTLYTDSQSIQKSSEILYEFILKSINEYKVRSN